MKTNGINLNKIFKAPLFRAMSFVALFFSFLFLGTISHAEKVNANFMDYLEGSGVYNSGNSIMITSTYATFDIEAHCDCFTLGKNNITLVLNGTTIKNEYAMDASYSNAFIYVTVSTSYSSISVTKDSNNNWIYVKIPANKAIGTLKITHKYALLGSYTESWSLVDWTSPSTPTVQSNSSGGSWSNQDVYIKVGGSSDAHSSVDHYEYSYDKSNWLSDIDGTGSYNNSGGAYGSWRAERDNYVYFRACDTAGNCSGASSGTRVRIDKTFPSFDSYELHGADAFVNLWTNSQTVVGSASGTDNTSGSGIGKVYFKEGSTTLYTSSSNVSQASFNLANNNAGEHTVSIYVCDKASNCVYITVVMYYDKTAPVITKFSTSSGTIGDNDGRYITGDSFSASVKYSDDMGVATAVSSCTLSGTIYGATSDYSYFTPRASCDLSSVAVDFEKLLYATLIVFDIAGNYTTSQIEFYRVDNSRKLTISYFDVRACGSFEDNYIGQEYVTGGGFAPVYSISSNSNYKSTSAGTYLDIYVGDDYGYYYGDLYHPFSYGYINSGNYYWFDSTYFYDALWGMIYDFGYIEYSSATLGLKNIYGQTTYAYEYSLIFDLYDPYIDYFEVYDEDGDADYGWTNQTDLYVYESSYDYETGIAYYEIYSDEGGYLDSGYYDYPYYIDLYSTYNGTHNLEYYVYDYAGNWYNYYTSIIYDDVSPDFSSLTTSTGTIGKNGSRYVTANTFTATADYSDENGIYYFGGISGTTWASDKETGLGDLTSSITFDITSKSINYDTQIYVYAWVRDQAGNYSYEYIYFYKIDTTRKVSIDSFKVDGYGSLYYNWIGSQSTTGGKVAPVYTTSNTTWIDEDYMYLYTETLLSWLALPTTPIISCSNCSDIYNTITSGKYVRYEDGYSSSYSTTSAWYASLEDNSNAKWSLWLRNIYGQTTSISVTVYYDLTSPTISTFNVVGNSEALAGYTNTRNVSLSISAADTNLAKFRITDSISSTTYTIINTLTTTAPTSATLGSSANGTRNLVLYVADKAGNTVARTDTIVLDTINPFFENTFVVTGNSGALAGYTNTRNVTYSGISASDANPYLYRVVDGGTQINGWTTTAPTSGTLANSTNGIHTIYVYMIDKAGNTGYETYDIELDTVYPTISSYTVKGNSTAESGYTKQQTISLSYSASDKNLYWYYVYDGANLVKSSSSKITSASLYDKTNGSHTVKVQIRDKAGNYSYVTKSIIYDDIAPVAHIDIDKDNLTAVIYFTDTYLGTGINSKIGSNYTYYMSENSSVNLSQVTMIPAIAGTDNGSNQVMYISGQSYYLYIVTNEKTRDKAGNYVANNGSSNVSGFSGYIFKIKVNMDNGFKDDSTSLDEDNINSNTSSGATKYNALVTMKDRLLIVTLQTEAIKSITLESLNLTIADSGYKVISVANQLTYTFELTKPYSDVLISKTDYTQNEIVELIIIIEEPDRN